MFLSNGPNENEYQSEATDICDDKNQNKKRNITKQLPNHNMLDDLQYNNFLYITSIIIFTVVHIFYNFTAINIHD